jgi:opacity protein-like surface antigen
MTLFSRAALAAIAALAFAPVSGALAADYEPPVIAAQPAEVPVEIGTGWYLRGDVGYAFSTKPSGSFGYRTFDPVTASYGKASFDRTGLGDNMTYGIGFGYTFNEWFRADLTLDGFRTPFHGSTASAFPCSTAAGFAGTACRSEDSARASTFSLMANGYLDLGTYAGFTPYVGAGAGVSLVKWDDLKDSTYCVDALAPCPGPDAFVGSATHKGKSSYRFTYALMGGLAYSISPNLKLDLSYKYTHIDGGDMFDWDSASSAAGASGIQGTDHGFSNHQVRLGLRYELW